MATYIPQGSRFHPHDTHVGKLPYIYAPLTTSWLNFTQYSQFYVAMSTMKGRYVICLGCLWICFTLGHDLYDLDINWYMRILYNAKYNHKFRKIEEESRKLYVWSYFYQWICEAFTAGAQQYLTSLLIWEGLKFKGSKCTFYFPRLSF